MSCPRCQRTLIGTTRWCLVHGDQADYGPYAGEDARDRRDAAKIDREAEIDDEAVQLSFELPFRRPMVVSTFSEGEMATWTAAHR
jgi:hypothetical protein